jgi:PII-like signaling protein
MTKAETMKMWCLRIRIKRNDEIEGNPLKKLLLNLLMNAKISDATVWTGIDGFGKRGRAATYLEGVLYNKSQS